MAPPPKACPRGRFHVNLKRVEMKQPERMILDVPQADSYSQYPRRMMLMARVQKLLRRYYPAEEDAYRLFEEEIAVHLKADRTLLDAGCGRTAPVLTLFASKVAKPIGVDLVKFSTELRPSRVTLLNCNLADLPLRSESVDVVISRSVVEHLADPAAVQREFFRVLKPGGRFIFITPNVWSYPVAIARLVPNYFHAAVVDWAEGRPTLDTFETYYRSNSFRTIRRLAARTGFTVESMRYLSMFPNYLMFHPWAFMVGVIYERMIRRAKILHPLQHWILAVLLRPESPASR
jgi:SAM-dependent methyltransferase